MESGELEFDNALLPVNLSPHFANRQNLARKNNVLLSHDDSSISMED